MSSTLLLLLESMPLAFLSHLSARSQRGIHRVVQLIGTAVILVVGIMLFTRLVFTLFPLAHQMATNADSLVLFDFARDVISGHDLHHWNLPRAPYLFPDTAIALLVISVGWFGELSIYCVALINSLLLVVVSFAILRSSAKKNHTTLLGSAFFIALALLTLAICFPFAMANIYWQIFASGTHFLSALVVLAILQLDDLWQKKLLSNRVLWLILALSFLEALSDSLAAVLLMLWLGAEVSWRIAVHLWPTRFDGLRGAQANFASSVFLKVQLDLALVFGGVLAGTLAASFIPRQSLLESFLSLDKFKIAATSFTQWLIGEPSHILYLLALIILNLLYPWVIRARIATKHNNFATGAPTPAADPQVGNAPLTWMTYLRSSILAPSLGVICITPFFFQDVGSIRYFVFPALVSILSLALLYRHCWNAFGGVYRLRQRFFGALVLMAVLGLIGHWQWQRERIGPNATDTTGLDQVGLAVGSDASGAANCIAKAQAQWPLHDGVATYWNARPIRFVSHFQYYVAQINPWRPRNGAFVWGNNGIDLVYADVAAKTPRQYNFIVATNHEINSRLWGSLPAQATQSINCKNYSVFYFDNDALLWNYLFPMQVPYGFDELASANQMRLSSEKNTAPNSLVRTYWGDDVMTQVGIRNGNTIVANGAAGFLVYGPYIPLAPGRYRLTAKGELGNEAMSSKASIGILEVTGAIAQSQIASAPIVNHIKQQLQNSLSQTIASVDFQLSTLTENIEFRIAVVSQTRGVFMRYELEKLSD